MMRVDTVYYEVVPAGGGARIRYDTADEARENRGTGQVRQRVSFVDVPAEYAVRLDGVEIDRCQTAADAAGISRQNPGSSVHMVPSDPDAPDTA
jgi:hypothetical protein